MTEMCRKCGGELTDFSYCVICRESMQRICSLCINTTEESFHQNCTYQLHVLKIFPTPPDVWFEKHKNSVTFPSPISNIKNKVMTPSYEKNRAVIAVAKALEKIGRPVLEQVYGNLYSKYHCYLIDCYDNPEYLADVLKELFGKSYKNIIETIEENTKYYEPKEPLEEFLAIIRSTR